MVSDEVRGAVRIHASAECSLPFLTVAAASVRYIERHYDSVAFLEERNTRAGFDHYSHILMT
jgi:hypothetical protein